MAIFKLKELAKTFRLNILQLNKSKIRFWVLFNIKYTRKLMKYGGCYC